MVPLKGVVNYQLSIYGLLVLKQLQNQLNFIHLHDHNFRLNDKCRLEGLNLKTFLLYFKYLLFLHFYDFQITMQTKKRQASGQQKVMSVMWTKTNKIKVMKSQNEYVKLSHCPKYERNIREISALEDYIDQVCWSE